MVREENRHNKKLNQNEIELKVAGGYYLVSEGRYVNWKNFIWLLFY